VDASHEKFHNLYLQVLQAELKKAGRSIDYIFVSHTEPDHSGLIPAVLDLYPEATVVGSKVTKLNSCSAGQPGPVANPHSDMISWGEC
jgi:flavorubredoxin